MAGSFMARCYSGRVPIRQPPLPAPWPETWLLSDERNDDTLHQAMARLPRGSGLIFRHYQLGPGRRLARFRELARLARRLGHRIVLSGNAREARALGAHGVYGAARPLAVGPALPRLVTAHSLREIAHARRARADAILLSPVFPTRSHPGARSLGPARFRLLARHAGLPVIALGGMNRHRARSMRWKNWAAIDGI
ncbi:MAG TPA: thiamine phosphate synthase [Novosphingobium sp.]|nr:thiamine phosphate synthase [Novosphingobium sp.]